MPYALTDHRSQAAVDTGERYTEGLVSEEERQAVREAAQEVVENAVAEQQWQEAAGAADARRCVGEGKDQIVRLDPPSAWHPYHLHLMRELFGVLPFRAIPLNPAWLAWNDGTIPKLAQAIYDDRVFDRLPVLADALEEAGCDNADILDHCRQPGEHVRGCWVVDLLLGKE
jgi:hypothetical protein